MKIKNMLALSLILGSTSAMAVQIPSISPLLGTYKGDCTIQAGADKAIAAAELLIERDGQKVKISFASEFQDGPTITSLRANEKTTVVDPNNSEMQTIELLSIKDLNLRKWTYVSSYGAIAHPDVSSITRREFDFSKPSVVKIKVSGTFMGMPTNPASCTLEKMNINAK